MSPFQTRFERLELKFLVDEVQAARVRDQLVPYCTADPHSQAGQGYPIRSLYLDTPALAFHAAKERGDPDRVKLRVRTYSETSPATLEVKRRHSDIIDKTRAVVGRDSVEDAARGLPVPVRAQASEGFLQEFARVVSVSGAGPTLTVRYEREAYESVVDRYARVTFDRHIEVQPSRDWSLRADGDWCAFDDRWGNARPTAPVVLEIKCENRVPWWVTDLVRRNELVRTSFSKYSIGIALTQLQAGRAIGRSRSLRALEAA